MEDFTELIFIPFTGIGHLISMVELAKLVVDRDERLSVTILIMNFPFDTKVDPYVQSFFKKPSTKRIRLLEIPPQQVDLELLSKSLPSAAADLMDRQKPHVRDIVTDLLRDSSSRLAGFVIDMFCTPMVDVAAELLVPSYIYFPSGADLLGLMFKLQSLRDDQGVNVCDFNDSDDALSVPAFANPVPVNVFPAVATDKAGESTIFLDHAKRFHETKGIIINTFLDLETHAIKSLLEDSSNNTNPPLYPVGPILNLQNSEASSDHRSILSWLDNQPASSVVFLCFGSRGFFDEDQVKEITVALERSRHRFLWSLRRPPPKDKKEFPADCYENPELILPEGFLERTAGIGKVIGWAPQVEVLSHPAVGGFVSHCGWNSTLESLWFGVPMATWPKQAEQQLNAFQLVKELDIAVEIKIEYMRTRTKKYVDIVTAEEIEASIGKLMADDSEIRKKVKEMSKKSRAAIEEGGSSYIYLTRLVDDVIRNHLK